MEDQEDRDRIIVFFRVVFSDKKGKLCLGFKERGLEVFRESFFDYPTQVKEAAEFVIGLRESGDIYFCTQLLGKSRRLKENVLATPCAWADLDGCPPEASPLKPSVSIESSPGRYQGIWVFSETVDPLQAEEISKRIAYGLAEEGCDKTGWPLTKYLRVPGTYNYKYAAETGYSPPVRTLNTNVNRYSIKDFDIFPPVEDNLEVSFPFPTGELPEPTDVMLYRRNDIPPLAMDLYSEEPPEGKWSERLWSLEMLLFESGLTKEEVFVLARKSACNKYERDNRSERGLWKEVCKAYIQNSTPQVDFDGDEDFFTPELELLSDDERAWVAGTPTIVEDYVNWASTLSDAAWQYHEAGIFTILSAILCSFVRLPTSAAILNLNLWFMILANTTLTRKTTAMGIAMSLLDEVDPDSVLATDGSIEGLFSGLSARPGRASIFLRDEISGLLEQMQKGDYRAGLGEAFAKLYDGNREKRVLRKETIEVKDPRLILFTGGVKNKVYELLDHSHVLTGFLPRFIFVTAEPEIKKLKPMGPPTVENMVKRAQFVCRLQEIFDFYDTQKSTIMVSGQMIGMQKKVHDAELTGEAWDRFNRYSESMLEDALKSIYRDSLVPTYDRLSKSGLKVATLIAATRCEEKVVVTDDDIVRAFFYIERWRRYAFEVVTNLGKNQFEKVIDKVIGYIAREPGITKSKLMRLCLLSTRNAAEVLDTLAQRGMLRRDKFGKNERLFMIGSREMEATNA